ncbi:unnamed protein product, partial [Durusdinium trenchii]
MTLGFFSAVIEGDIGKLSTVVELFEAYPRSTCVALGFSCQPFSHAGDQRAGPDERALSLPHALFFSWVTQAPAIVIECVCEAASSAFVKQVLQAFTSVTRYEKSETIMDLSSMWPSKRKRWWLVLTVISPTVKYSILPLPDHHFQATGAISGFRMSKRKLQDPAPTPVPRSGDSSELQSASVIPIPREPISQDGVSHARVLKPFVRASAPEEFVDSSISIIRVCDNSVQAIKTKGTISVASFLRAETAISGCRGQVFDILGCRLTDEALLDPGSFYVYTESDQIPEAMTSRITWLSANGARVAVDEMEFYIRTVSTTFKMPWVPPMIIEDLASAPTISAAWLSEVSGALDESGIVSAILANGHWMPVIVHQAPHGKTRFIVTQAGVFRQQNGGELPQLKINQISPTAAGLALLVISPSKYLLDKFGELIRFPVVCVRSQCWSPHCFCKRTSAIESVLKQSGSHGCYIEIRAPDGKRDDVNHYTVWLPRKSLREAQAEQAAIKEPSAIIRVGH